MRIGIEVQRLFRMKKHGMEVVALQLIRHLQQIDHENQYFIFVKEGSDSNCIQETENFKIVVVPGLTYADWEQVWFPRAVKNARLDLLHCTCNTSPVLSLNVPVLLTLHDIIFLESVSMDGSGYQNFGNLYRRWVVPHAVKRSARIIAVSNWEKANINRKLDESIAKTEVVYNAVNDQFRVMEDIDKLDKIRSKYQLPAQFILYFSNASPRKNAKGVIKAYAKYRKLAGENALPLVLKDSDKNFTLDLVKNLKNEIPHQNLIILDFIPQDELPVLYNLATLFLYPSLREGFGLPILESMASGTPVITSNTSAMPEVAADAAILCDPFNPYDIAASMHKVLSDGNLYFYLVEKGLERHKAFRWEMAAKSIHKIYIDMVGNEIDENNRNPVLAGYIKKVNKDTVLHS